MNNDSNRLIMERGVFFNINTKDDNMYKKPINEDNFDFMNDTHMEK